MTTHSSNEPILTWLSAVRSKASDLPHSARSVALAILTHVHPETGMTPPLSYAALQQEAVALAAPWSPPCAASTTPG
ncbi:hypothetical protein GS438_22060 [Rhodococcus hoagii]|nr:hypothetical protein [Prescottella equi]